MHLPADLHLRPELPLRRHGRGAERMRPELPVWRCVPLRLGLPLPHLTPAVPARPALTGRAVPFTGRRQSSRAVLRRRALATTLTEDSAIAPAAMTGDSRMPKTG